MPAASPSTPGARPSSSASQYRPPSRAQSKDERSAPKEDVTRALQDYVRRPGSSFARLSRSILEADRPPTHLLRLDLLQQLGDLLGKGASGAVYRKTSSSLLRPAPH